MGLKRLCTKTLILLNYVLRPEEIRTELVPILSRTRHKESRYGCGTVDDLNLLNSSLLLSVNSMTFTHDTIPTISVLSLVVEPW